MGKVVAVEPEKGWMLVRTQRSSEEEAGCSFCALKSSCAVDAGGEAAVFPVKIVSGIQIGECVEIVQKPLQRIVVSFIFFLLPVLSLFIGYFLAKSIFPAEEWFAIVSSVVALGGTFFLVYLAYRKNVFHAAVETVRRVEVQSNESVLQEEEL